MPRRFAATLALAVAATLAPADDPDKPDAELAARVAELVRQLGDDTFARRQAAERDLTALGPAVLPALDALGPSDNPEVTHRLGRVRRAVGGAAGELRDILLALSPPLDGPDDSRDLDPATLDLIRKHQTVAGDYLVATATTPGHPLRRPAANALARAWDRLSADQARRYLERAVAFDPAARPAYPAGVDAMIGAGVRFADGAGGQPTVPGFRLTTETAYTLDGKPYGKPDRVPNLTHRVTAGWVRTRGLAVGRHTLAGVVRFEATHAGKTVAGAARSAEVAFQIVAADTPDDLAARPDPAAEKLIRAALWAADTEEGKDEGEPARDWRRPQYTWKEKDGTPGGLHVPVWRLERPLPFDLAFDVFLRADDTGEEYPAGSLIAVRGGTRNLGHVFVDDHRAVAKGRAGFVPVRVVLRPSRGMALTEPRVTRYYAGEVVLGPLRMRVGPANAGR